MKSQKELAFLEDLYIATDWGERFALLVDEHVELPKEGRALYLAAGTGAHALALQARAGNQLKLLCVDENEECLELARAKAVVVNQEAEFRRENLSALSCHDDEFDLVLGNGSMVAPPQLPKMIGEMVRVARPGAVAGHRLKLWRVLLNLLGGAAGRRSGRTRSRGRKTHRRAPDSPGRGTMGRTRRP